MPSRYRIMFGAALFSLLAFVCYAATRSDTANGDRTATTCCQPLMPTARIPRLFRTSTATEPIDFGDFVIFAGVFGARQGDEKYEATV